MTKPALILMGLLAAIPGAFADPLWQDELNWLKIMAFASHQTDYSGTFLYQYGNHVEISRITHVVDRDGEHSRLESLDGVRHEIILNNGQVLCYLGGRKVKLKEHQGTPRTFPALLPEQLSLLNENYQVKQGEEGKVAGFHAHAMILQPKDNLRYIHKMWAHSDSGLLLKAEVLDDRSRVIEQNTFIQLNMDGNIDRSWIEADKPDAVLIARQQRHAMLPKTEAMASASGWQVDMLPAGFKKITEVRRPMLGKKAPVIQLVFSDGLAGISVFIESSDDDQDDHTGLSGQGAVQVYSKVAGDYLITVVGEVPPRTVMRVADSVRYGGQ